MSGFTMISDLVAAGQDFGVFEFYLPWIIMFAIFWALLTKIKIFGDSEKEGKSGKTAKAVNLIVSLGASLYIMANTAIGISFASFLSVLFGGTFMVILTIIAFVAVLYVIAASSMGSDSWDAKGGFKGRWKWVIAFAGIGAVILVLGVYISTAGAALFPGITIPGFDLSSTSTPIPSFGLPSINLSTQDMAIIILVVITGAIIFYITYGGKPEKDGDTK